MPTVDSPNQITSYRSMAIMFEIISLIADRHTRPDSRPLSSIRRGWRAAEGAQVADASASALNRGHASAAQGPNGSVHNATAAARASVDPQHRARLPEVAVGARAVAGRRPVGILVAPNLRADTPWVRALGTESGKRAVEIEEMGRDGLLQGGLTDENGPAPGSITRTRSSTEARAPAPADPLRRVARAERDDQRLVEIVLKGDPGAFCHGIGARS